MTEELLLQPQESNRLVHLCGPLDENLAYIGEILSVEIRNRGYQFQISGQADYVASAIAVLTTLYQLASNPLSKAQIHLQSQQEIVKRKEKKTTIEHLLCEGKVKGRSQNQKIYIDKILAHDINFGIGPAGTGKTYLAVACAVDQYLKQTIQRIVLVRPTVEAGESLGFLPGDVSQKVNPYLRPLFDALYEFLGVEKVQRLIEQNIIEIAPLAYMRGRTLNEAFIILDEAQNTTEEQMKMFLTRMGYCSKIVVTGDITQIDLAKGKHSGLKHVMPILQQIKGISFTTFHAKDVVRHCMVAKIIKAYEKHS